MASIQEKLNQASINRSRKLFDRDIKRKGVQCQVLRLLVKEDNLYGDPDQNIISDAKIESYISWPPEMPLLRKRLTETPAMSEETDTSWLAFWESLPIFAYFKWVDNIVTGDLLVHVFFDENQNKVPVVLRVVNEVGSFHTHLNWRRAVLAVHNGKIPTELLVRIEAYLAAPLS